MREKVARAMADADAVNFDAEAAHVQGAYRRRAAAAISALDLIAWATVPPLTTLYPARYGRDLIQPEDTADE
ncbi:MAG: hypothetical protein CML61_07370 [Rhodobacteraceae bacterium]|nr:hypothetical protein [Paracoccaceae bacterium]|tara:strand:+ start:273 stop:488 length:216 start_codon:yes stop_codon:yes gene_type:complete